MDRFLDRFAGRHVPAPEFRTATDRDKDPVVIDQRWCRTHDMYHRRKQGRPAIIRTIHCEHPRELVAARRDQTIGFPVEREGMDLLGMTPARIEKRLPADIPDPRDPAGDGQVFPIRAKGQRRDFALVLDSREPFSTGDFPDLDVARTESQGDRATVGAELGRVDAGQRIGPGKSSVVRPGPDDHLTRVEVHEQQVPVRLKIEPGGVARRRHRRHGQYRLAQPVAARNRLSSWRRSSPEPAD